MCGIAGVINRKNVPIDNYFVIDKMLSRIKHRGPDDTGVCGITLSNELLNEKSSADIKANVRGLLGFNRLSIQDITYAGHQPMESIDKTCVITFNGEIYNVKELKEKLCGEYGNNVYFRGNSDTEVVLNMYLKYGFYETVRNLNGMFAIVIYDKIQNMLYIARDRYGIIPLHLCIDDELILWSSEIKAFLEHPKFKREINEESVALNMLYRYPNDPLMKQVENMEPGTILEWNAESDIINVTNYYDINQYYQRDYDSKCDYLEETRAVLYDCVNRQLIGDVELGVQMSGGVDSTLLANVVSSEFEKQHRQLNGFALTNHDTPGYDEEKWIDFAASKNRINNVKVDMDFAHFIEAMEHSIYAFERPMYSSPPLGIYLFSKRAGEDVKVLTSGEGADEIGGGYPELFGKYYAYAVSERAIPSELDCVNGGMDFIKSFDSLKVIMDNNDDFLVHADLSNAIEKRMTYWKSLTGTPFDKMRKMHFKYRLISMLERQNKVCMSNSVENRVPFLDNKFVDFMFTLPEELLMHKKNIITDNYSERYEGKYILKELSSQVYGKEFAYRKKQAIQVPWGKYFSEPEMIEYINEIIVPGMKKRNFIDMDSFNSRLKHLNDGGNIVKVWKYINFELWCQFFIDGRTEFYQR